MKNNNWTTFNDYALADFSIEFQSQATIEMMLKVAEELIGISNKYSICQIDIDGNKSDYLNYLKYTWNSLGYIYPYYLPGYKYYSSSFKCPSTKLSFFEKGEIVENFVSEICNINGQSGYLSLAKKFDRYTFLHNNFDNKYWELLSPITIGMNCHRANQKGYSPWGISGCLRTDIWLEKIGAMKVFDENGNSEWKQNLDNTELALLNTPRLNSFLRDLKELAKKFDGVWIFESEKGFLHSRVEVYENHAIPIGGEVIYAEDVNTIS